MSEESSGNGRKIEVIFSPKLFSTYFEQKDCVVVVIDIFRATSTICAAFKHGVKEVIPVATLAEAEAYKQKGYLVGAERKSEIVEGFDFGNSPLNFNKKEFRNKSIVFTTTNGTRAIELAKNADKVVVGAFTNISALCTYLEKEDKDVLLLCAGWKDRFNLEDTLFAGAVAYKLSKNLRFNKLSDSSIASINMFKAAKDDMYKFLEISSHRKRLSRLNLEEDIIYCLTLDKTDIVPILEGGKLIANK